MVLGEWLLLRRQRSIEEVEVGVHSEKLPPVCTLMRDGCDGLR